MSVELLLLVFCGIPAALALPALVLIWRGFAIHTNYAGSAVGAEEMTGKLVQNFLQHQREQGKGSWDSINFASMEAIKPNWKAKLFLNPGIALLWLLDKYIHLLFLPIRVIIWPVKHIFAG